MDNDIITQFLIYMLGYLPGNVAAHLIGAITIGVTLCTLILRFWPEPKAGTTAHKIWEIIHLIASFKKAGQKV